MLLHLRLTSIFQSIKGFLVEYLNTDEAAQRVCQLIEDTELRKKMGAKARVNVQRYKREVIMRQWIDLFNSLSC